jgi:hypothetical protein
MIQMNRQIVVAAIVVLMASAGQAGATVRNFFFPEWEGIRLNACLSDPQSCGKPAADAFCRMKGFDTALLFQREASAVTRIIGTDLFCKGPDCMAFRQIKCRTEKDDFAGLQ